MLIRGAPVAERAVDLDGGEHGDVRSLIDHCRSDLDVLRRSPPRGPGGGGADATLERRLATVADRLERITSMVEMAVEADGAYSAAAAQTLAREADHRIRNHLQLVASLLNRQAGQTDVPPVSDALRLAATQIGAVAALHSALHTASAPGSSNGSGIDLSAYLEALAQNCIESFGFDGTQRSLEVELQPLMVTPETARSVGLIVTELVTNAVRHAFRPDLSGKIKIVGEPRRGDGCYQLSIADDGDGLPRGFDLRLRRTGFGLRLVSLLADSFARA